MSEEPIPYLLDRKRAAAFLGVSGQTIYDWCKRGMMPKPAREMPRKKYWSRDSLIAFQASRKEKVAGNSRK